MTIGLSLGSEIPIHDADGEKLWSLRVAADGDISLNRHNSSGVEQEEVIGIDSTTGIVTISAANLADGTITPVDLAAGVRELADAAAITIAATDRIVRVTATSTATTAVTMTATHSGHVVMFCMTAGDADSVITLAVTQGTITMNAANEACGVYYDGSDWNLLWLSGATIA